MKYAFPDNFWWGSASSALQTEGTRRGETTWDYWFAREPDRFHNGVGAAYLHVLSALENGHSAVKTAEPQQLSYFHKLGTPDPRRYR